MDILYLARYTFHASLRMELSTYIGCWPGHVVFHCLLCSVCAVVRCVTDTMQLMMKACVCFGDAHSFWTVLCVLLLLCNFESYPTLAADGFIYWIYWWSVLYNSMFSASQFSRWIMLFLLKESSNYMRTKYVFCYQLLAKYEYSSLHKTGRVVNDVQRI